MRPSAAVYAINQNTPRSSRVGCCPLFKCEGGTGGLLAQQETDGGTMRWRGKKLRGGDLHFLGTRSAESLGPIGRAQPVNHSNTCHGRCLSPPGGPASPREPAGRSGPAHTGPPCPSPSPGCPGSAPCSGTRTPPRAPAGQRAGGGGGKTKEGEGKKVIS